MTGILARVRFINILGAEICYVYHNESLKQMGISPSESDHSITFIQIGTELTIDERPYKVVRINTIFHKDTYEVENYGTSVSSFDEQMPFNFEIIYFVENA